MTEKLIKTLHNFLEVVQLKIGVKLLTTESVILKPILEALLGDEYTIDTLDGPITVKIPEGIHHGEILRVKGKGVPIERGRRGDLMIKIQIDLPTTLSKEARKLAEEMKRHGI